jgi:hypothetical protein
MLTLLKILQVGGMLGGSAIAIGMIFPQIPILIWAPILGIFLSFLIYKNYYSIIEKTSILMVAGFTLLTLASVLAISFTPFGFTFSDVLTGLRFELPPDLVFIAIGAFGITGVASDEIIAYTYWCLEKGYATYTGVNDGSEEWQLRANGWIKIMQLDAIVAMVIYTIVTAAFYLLGASILHGQKEIPEGNELINSLALIYTQSLGSEARLAYLAGAFFVLYSSVFATLAYWSRLFPDIFGQLGWINAESLTDRKKWVAILAWLFPCLWVIAYLFIEMPTFMILSGGAVGSILLLIVVFAAINFRSQNKFLKIASGPVSEIMFWLSVASIASISVYGILKLF